jgi:hypothetical protein
VESYLREVFVPRLAPVSRDVTQLGISDHCFCAVFLSPGPRRVAEASDLVCGRGQRSCRSGAIAGADRFVGPLIVSFLVMGI